MKIEKYDVWFLDDDVDKQAEKLFGIPLGEASRVVHEEVSSTSQGQQSLVVEIFKESDPDKMAFALARGILKPSAVILDVNFQKNRARSFRFLDIPAGSETAKIRSTLGIQILRTFKRIDPALPVLVLTETHGREFEFGRLGATDYLSKTTIAPNPLSQIQFAGRLVAAVRQVREVPVYDLDHHTVADKIAASYDYDERNRVGTVAYYRFENEIIVREIGGLLQHREHVRVLDVGCGPGRIAEAIARQPWKGKVELVGIDFSANMLEAAHTALSVAPETYQLGFHETAAPCTNGSKLTVSLFRAAAENLTFLRTRYPDGFDFLICGFGVPCYVNLDFVLPIDIEQKGAQGLVALARDSDSRFLFSVYNEKSLIFKTPTAEDNTAAVRRRPVAALMDLKKGRLKITGGFIKCDAYSAEGWQRRIGQAGLDAVSKIRSFPSLHLLLDNEVAMAQACASAVADDQPACFAKDPWFPPGAYSPFLYETEMQNLEVFMESGHYLVVIACKRAALQ